jgi:hypothetical protein
MLEGFYRPPTTDQVDVDFFNRVLLPASGLAGTDTGIVNLTKGRMGHGIPHVVISVTSGIFEMIIGAAGWQGQTPLLHELLAFRTAA